MALLLSSYPHDRGKLSDGEWKQAQLRIYETFCGFPTAIGFAAVDPLKGIPSKLDFLPKPFDIVKFCNDQLQRLNVAKIMAGRHIAELKRRADEREEDHQPPTPEAKARVAAMVAKMHGYLEKSA